MPQVIRSIDIQAAPSKVWHWFASQQALRRWISCNIQIDLRVGGGYRFREEKLILSWLEEASGWQHPARLVITLAPIPAGTRVTLIHDGFEGIGRPDWPDTLQDYERGADAHRVLDHLADLVSTGDAQQE